MKKLLLTDINKLELVEEPIPVPGEEEAVIRVKYGGICGSDMHIMSGHHPAAQPPFVMGHEVCGEIAEIHSKRRTDLKVGDKVAIHAVKGCGSCEMCRAGRENLCKHIEIMGAGCDGFYSEYVLCRADRIIPFKPDVDMKIAALVEPLTIAVHDVRRSGLMADEDVFITGAGTIGVLIGMVAKLTGAAHVVLAEINPDRRRIARELGFEVVDISAPDFEAQCLAINGGAKYDKVFEVTGFQSGFDNCLRMLKQGATMVQVGMPGSGIFESGFNVNAIIFNEVNYLGVRNSTARSMEAAAKIINDGLLDDQLRKVISAVYPKEKGIEAFDTAREDKTMLKVLIDFS
ncbi:MAG: zinc-binding dehydrogenase [Intestinibacillus sp.]